MNQHLYVPRVAAQGAPLGALPMEALILGKSVNSMISRAVEPICVISAVHSYTGCNVQLANQDSTCCLYSFRGRADVEGEETEDHTALTVSPGSVW